MSGNDEVDSVVAVPPSESTVTNSERLVLRRLWWLLIVVISSLAVGLSLFRDEISASDSGIAWLIRASGATRLDLAVENGLGAWWSGMLLLLAALHAMDGFVHAIDRNPKTGRAWLLMAGILVALSIDEVGSLHERVSMFIPPYGVKANLPFFAVMIFVLAFSLRALWQSGVYRRQVWLIATAFFLFAMVIVQEILENRTNWWGDADNFREALEEGSEIVGMFLLLLATSRNSAGIFDQNGRGFDPVFESLRQHLIVLAVLALLLALPLAYGNRVLDDIPRRGIPVNWLASAVFFVTFIAILRPALQGRRSILSRHTLVAGTCLLLSIVCVRPYLDAPARKAEILLIGTSVIVLLQLSCYGFAVWRRSVAVFALGFVPAAIVFLRPTVIGVSLVAIVIGVVVLVTTRLLEEERMSPGLKVRQSTAGSIRT